MTVYFVDIPQNRGKKEGPAIDIDPARGFGEIQQLLRNSSELALTPAAMIQQLQSKLADFSDDDCLVPCGDPIAIGAAVTVAAHNSGGRVSLLKWDKKLHCYVRVLVEF